MSDTLLLNSFTGVVHIRTCQGRWMGVSDEGGKAPQLDDDCDSFDWQMMPSRKGAYFIGYQSNGRTYNWQCNHNKGLCMQLHTGADDWESFIVESHPMGGYAFKSVSSGAYICTKPLDQDRPRAFANAPHMKEWEQFFIDIVSNSLPEPAAHHPLVDALLQNRYAGVVRISTHHGRYMGASPEGAMPGRRATTLQLDDDCDSFDWTMKPSPKGGCFIFCEERWQTHYWQCNNRCGLRMQLNTSADEWGSFILESHPMGGYALKCVGSGSYVCVQPLHHEVRPRTIANRPHKKQWEQFFIEFVSQP